MKIFITSNHPYDFLNRFAAQFGLVIEGNQITFPEQWGEGFIEQIALPDEIFLTIMDITLKAP